MMYACEPTFKIGTWWLKQCANPKKALHFFCLSSDASKAAALVEESLWMLMTSVSDCGRLASGPFHELTVRCSRPGRGGVLETVEALEATALPSRIGRNLLASQQLLNAFESSTVGVLYERQRFLAAVMGMTSVLHSYVALVSSLLESDSNETSHSRDAVCGMANLIGTRKVPLRFCLHFIEMIVWTETRRHEERCALNRKQVEGLLLLFHRTRSSQFADAYLADTTPVAMRDLTGSALQLFARCLLQENKDAGSSRANAVAQSVSKREPKKKSLMDCIMAT